jgi:multidrug resistance efflux pump
MRIIQEIIEAIIMQSVMILLVAMCSAAFGWLMHGMFYRTRDGVARVGTRARRVQVQGFVDEVPKDEKGRWRP